VTFARAGLVVAIVIFTSSTCWARDPSPREIQEARALFAKAERDERARDWKGALEKLEQAGAVKMTPGIRFHIALCREKLGALVEALADYEAAAVQARAEGVGDVLDAVRDPLADLRARVPSLSLTIVNAPAEGVDVAIDDRPIAAGALASPIRLAPGTHRNVARRAGNRAGRPFTKDIELHERDTHALDLALPAAEAPAAVERAAPQAPETSLPAAAAPPEAPATTPSRTNAIFATTGAALLVGAGVGAFLLAGRAQDELRDCTSPDDCTTKRPAVRTWDGLAIAAWASGAAVGAFAAVLWLRPARVPRVALAPAWNGASLRGTF
jgi:hypothetical protein